MVVAACILLLQASSLAYTPPPIRRTTRRAAVAGSAATLFALSAQSVTATSRSRSDGYEVQRSEREWNYVLSGQQYFVLREGGTEPPNSSPLVTEKRKGTFSCAGCEAPLFESSAKFNSGTGWPSFASALPSVSVEGGNAVATALLGTECRCGRCGGHLGDLFLDGFLFPGTAAFTTGKRYCIDGAALVFIPADGSERVSGEAPPMKSGTPELPSWLQPPPIKG
jgi:peptide-methionine (R)-S-oxide reductase